MFSTVSTLRAAVSRRLSRGFVPRRGFGLGRSCVRYRAPFSVCKSRYRPSRPTPATPLHRLWRHNTSYFKIFKLYLSALGLWCLSAATSEDKTPVTQRKRSWVLSRDVTWNFFSWASSYPSPDDGEADPPEADVDPLYTACTNRIIYHLQRGIGELGWTVTVANSPDSFRASTSPLDEITITTGTIDACRTEDEAAAILAHELAHGLCRHASEGVGNLCFWYVILLPVAGFVLSGVLAHLIVLSRWRAQEFEADEIATSILASAGYDPVGMLEFLVRAQSCEIPMRPWHRGWYDTHPESAARIENVQEVLAGARWSDIKLCKPCTGVDSQMVRRATNAGLQSTPLGRLTSARKADCGV